MSKLWVGIENKTRQETEKAGWKYRAALKDWSNRRRVRIICRDDEELAMVKGAAKATKSTVAVY